MQLLGALQRMKPEQDAVDWMAPVSRILITLLLSGHKRQVYFVGAPDPGRHGAGRAMALLCEQYVNSRGQRGLIDFNPRKEP